MRLSLIPLLIFYLAGCGPRTPEISKDLPSNYAEGQRVFDARVRKRFPLGSPETELVAELRRQGFSIVAGTDGQFATFSNRSFPIETVWHVGWKSDQGRITDVWGVHGGIGP